MESCLLGLIGVPHGKEKLRFGALGKPEFLPCPLTERLEDLRRHHNLQGLVLPFRGAWIGLDNVRNLCAWRRCAFLFQGGGVGTHLCNLLGLCERYKAVDDGLCKLLCLCVQRTVRGFRGGFSVVVRNTVGRGNGDKSVEG